MRSSSRPGMAAHLSCGRKAGGRRRRGTGRSPRFIRKTGHRFASCQSSTTGMATRLIGRISCGFSPTRLFSRAIDRMLKYVKEHGFAGLTIDFEGLPDSSLASFHAFLRTRPRLHAVNLLLSITVQAEQAEIQFAKIAEFCDRVIVMAFDEHWLNSPAGPLARADWFADIVEQRRGRSPGEAGVGDRQLRLRLAARQRNGQQDYREVMLTARRNKAQISLDKTSLNPTFTYQDSEQSSTRSGFWMRSRLSIRSRWHAERRRGASRWRLGNGFPHLDSAGKKSGSTSDAAANLATMTFKYRVNFTGDGDIYKVASPHRDGHRDVTYENQRGLITDEHATRNSPRPAWSNDLGLGQGSNDRPHVRRRTRSEIHPLYSRCPSPQARPRDLLHRRHERTALPRVDRTRIAGQPRNRQSHLHPSEGVLHLDGSITARSFGNGTPAAGHHRSPGGAVPRPYGSDIDPSTMDGTKPLETVTDMGYISVG